MLNQMTQFLGQGLITSLIFILFTRFLLQILSIGPGMNPWAHVVYQLTRPLNAFNAIFPTLNHGRFLTSALVFIFILKLMSISLTGQLSSISAYQLPALLAVLIISLTLGAISYFKTALIAHIIFSLASMLMQKQFAISDLLTAICEPLLAPLRARLPNLGPLDISVLVALLLFGVAQRLGTEALIQFSSYV